MWQRCFSVRQFEVVTESDLSQSLSAKHRCVQDVENQVEMQALPRETSPTCRDEVKSIWRLTCYQEKSRSTIDRPITITWSHLHFAVVWSRSGKEALEIRGSKNSVQLHVLCPAIGREHHIWTLENPEASAATSQSFEMQEGWSEEVDECYGDTISLAVGSWRAFQSSFICSRPSHSSTTSHSDLVHSSSLVALDRHFTRFVESSTQCYSLQLSNKLSRRLKSRR